MTPREVSEPWTHRDIDYQPPYPAFIPDTPDLNKELPPMPRPSMEKAPMTALYGSDDRHSDDYHNQFIDTSRWMGTDMDNDNDSELADVGEYIIC
jgi:hypothetical protein